jgi:hypothetical protein
MLVTPVETKPISEQAQMEITQTEHLARPLNLAVRLVVSKGPRDLSGEGRTRERAREKSKPPHSQGGEKGAERSLGKRGRRDTGELLPPSSLLASLRRSDEAMELRPLEACVSSHLCGECGGPWRRARC